MSENINENMTEKEAKKAEELKKKELEREKYQEQLNDPNLTKKEKKKIKRKKQIIHRNICLKTGYIIIEKKRKNRTFWRNWNLFRKRV